MNIPHNGISVTLITLFSGFLVQSIKFIISSIIDYKNKRKFNFGRNIKRMIEPGGMPSSHSSSVITLSLLVGLWNGFESILFGVTLFFSLLVIYDAAGLRRSVGKQAKVLNKIIEELNVTGHMQSKQIRELLGHTPIEIFVGSLLGAAIAFIFGKLL